MAVHVACCMSVRSGREHSLQAWLPRHQSLGMYDRRMPIRTDQMHMIVGHEVANPCIYRYVCMDHTYVKTLYT